MNVISICNADAAVTKERGDGTEVGVEAKGEELSAKRVTLACPAHGGNGGGRLAITSHVELRRCTVCSEGPAPEAREALADDR